MFSLYKISNEKEKYILQYAEKEDLDFGASDDFDNWQLQKWILKTWYKKEFINEPTFNDIFEKLNDEIVTKMQDKIYK